MSGPNPALLRCLQVADLLTACGQPVDTTLEGSFQLHVEAAAPARLELPQHAHLRASNGSNSAVCCVVAPPGGDQEPRSVELRLLDRFGNLCDDVRAEVAATLVPRGDMAPGFEVARLEEDGLVAKAEGGRFDFSWLRLVAGSGAVRGNMGRDVKYTLRFEVLPVAGESPLPVAPLEVGLLFQDDVGPPEEVRRLREELRAAERESAAADRHREAADRKLSQLESDHHGLMRDLRACLASCRSQEARAWLRGLQEGGGSGGLGVSAGGAVCAAVEGAVAAVTAAIACSRQAGLWEVLPSLGSATPDMQAAAQAVRDLAARDDDVFGLPIDLLAVDLPAGGTAAGALSRALAHPRALAQLLLRTVVVRNEAGARAATLVRQHCPRVQLDIMYLDPNVPPPGGTAPDAAQPGRPVLLREAVHTLSTAVQREPLLASLPGRLFGGAVWMDSVEAARRWQTCPGAPPPRCSIYTPTDRLSAMRVRVHIAGSSAHLGVARAGALAAMAALEADLAGPLDALRNRVVPRLWEVSERRMGAAEAAAKARRESEEVAARARSLTSAFAAAEAAAGAEAPQPARKGRQSGRGQGKGKQAAKARQPAPAAPPPDNPTQGASQDGVNAFPLKPPTPACRSSRRIRQRSNRSADTGEGEGEEETGGGKRQRRS